MEIYLFMSVFLTLLVAPTSGVPVCRDHPAAKPKHYFLHAGETVQLKEGRKLTTAGKNCYPIPSFAKENPVGEWILAPVFEDLGVYKVGYQLPHHPNPSFIQIHVVSEDRAAQHDFAGASQFTAPIWETVNGKLDIGSEKMIESEDQKGVELFTTIPFSTSEPAMIPTIFPYTTNAPAVRTSLDEPAPEISSTASTTAPIKIGAGATSPTTLPSVSDERIKKNIIDVPMKDESTAKNDSNHTDFVYYGVLVIVILLVILLIVFVLFVVKARH